MTAVTVTSLSPGQKRAPTMAALFYAIALCLLTHSFGKSLELSPPKWSNVYTVSGVLKLPYAEIVEPFQAWFDGQNGRSRIDYYAGKVISLTLPLALLDVLERQTK